MGAQEVLVLVVFCFHFCSPASLHPPSHTLPMVHLQANTEYKGEQEHLNNDKNGGNVNPHHDSSQGVTSGQVAGAGHENGGGSGSTYHNGGAAGIPIYAAGAAKDRHNNHHSAGSCIHFSIGSSTLTAILLAYILPKYPF